MLEINGEETSPTTTAFYQRLTSIETLIYHRFHINLNSLPAGKIKSLSLTTHITDNFSEFFRNNPQCTTINMRDLRKQLKRRQIQTVLTNVKDLNISIWDKHDFKAAVTAATLKLNFLTIKCHTIQLLNTVFRRIKHRNIKNITLTTLDNTHIKWWKLSPEYHRKMRSAKKIFKRSRRYPNLKVEKNHSSRQKQPTRSRLLLTTRTTNTQRHPTSDTHTFKHTTRPLLLHSHKLLHQPVTHTRHQKIQNV